MKAYCVKCKAQRPIADAVEQSLKNGRKALKGKCPTCGTSIFKMLPGKTAPAAKTDNAARTDFGVSFGETIPRAPGKPTFRLTFFHS